MSDRLFASPPATGSMQVGTNNCPRVADLIDYALGQASREDHQRVEAHVNGGGCSFCRGWIEKASHFRSEPWSNALPPSSPLLGSAQPSVSDQTPIPPSAKFQRQALRDLEQRLRLLDDPR